MLYDICFLQIFEDRYHSFSDPDIPRYICRQIFCTEEILFPLHLSNFCLKLDAVSITGPTIQVWEVCCITF